jgi:hypothetical protein
VATITPTPFTPESKSTFPAFTSTPALLTSAAPESESTFRAFTSTPLTSAAPSPTPSSSTNAPTRFPRKKYSSLEILRGSLSQNYTTMTTRPDWPTALVEREHILFTSNRNNTNEPAFNYVQLPEIEIDMTKGFSFAIHLRVLNIYNEDQILLTLAEDATGYSLFTLFAKKIPLPYNQSLPVYSLQITNPDEGWLDEIPPELYYPILFDRDQILLVTYSASTGMVSMSQRNSTAFYDGDDHGDWFTETETAQGMAFYRTPVNVKQRWVLKYNQLGSGKPTNYPVRSNCIGSSVCVYSLSLKNQESSKNDFDLTIQPFVNNFVSSTPLIFITNGSINSRIDSSASISQQSKALVFNGQTSYIKLPPLRLFYVDTPDGRMNTRTGLTFIVAVKVLSSRAWQSIFDFGHGPSLMNFVLCEDDQQQLTWTIVDSGGIQKTTLNVPMLYNKDILVVGRNEQYDDRFVLTMYKRETASSTWEQVSSVEDWNAFEPMTLSENFIGRTIRSADPYTSMYMYDLQLRPEFVPDDELFSFTSI